MRGVDAERERARTDGEVLIGERLGRERENREAD